MPEQTFKSPGFFDREIDLSARIESPSGVPAGVIGTSLRGPAFVPISVGSFADFEDKFGTLDPKHFGPYAVKKFLDNRSAVTYMRVLGAGANDTVDDIDKTKSTDQVRSAGFTVTGSTVDATDTRHQGSVQLLVAKHTIQTNEAIGMPLFTDNDSFVSSSNDEAFIVRAMILTASGTRAMILNGDEAVPTSPTTLDDEATLAAGKFKIAISSSVKLDVVTASLNPGSADYIAKVLNTNPDNFNTREHLLYLDFAVDDEIATVSTDAGSIAILSGSSTLSDDSGDALMVFRDAFGHFDTRFKTARSTWFISQPFGLTEIDLFHFEALDDGEYPNQKVKVSISNLRASTNPKNDYGTFTVQIRSWSDTDTNPEILEQFPGCSLDPTNESYVARRIGDRKTEYAFDSDQDEERRLKVSGKYVNKSRFVRIRMSDNVERSLTPAKALPFGFRGIPALKTNDLLSDETPAVGITRMDGDVTVPKLTGSIVPPVPFRFKTTRGNVATSGFPGAPGVSEETDGRYYWGVKLERNKNPLNSNTTREKNQSMVAYSKLVGLGKLDMLVTGSEADTFNENKFTLARVAFSNSAVSELTGSVAEHIRETAYIRNGNPDGTEYKIDDGVLSGRITLATLIALTSSADFNRFTDFTKFTNVLYGGFDGVNILDSNASRLNDKASSSDTGGGAVSGYVATGLDTNPAGEGKFNNAVNAYRTAARIMLDPFTLSSNVPLSPSINLLAVPGIRDSFVTDFINTSAKEYGLALYLMDVASYSDDGTRLFGDEATTRPDVEKTTQQFDSRAVDSSYSAGYFPDVIMVDEVNNRRVKVPSSVAALAAIGFNDRVGFPWFAPAGFNRGALDFVTGLDVRLTVSDRDTLYDNRLNPIANIIDGGQTSFVIFGQKTLQQAQSALDRANVRRLMLEIRRVVVNIAQGLVFEQNNVDTRAKFVTQVTPQMGLIQTQNGIEKFRVIMDETNNTKDDEEQNRMNGKIIIVPTRAVEFIAVDFIITNSGVSFD